jgi:hypothetical protein
MYEVRGILLVRNLYDEMRPGSKVKVVEEGSRGHERGW